MGTIRMEEVEKCLKTAAEHDSRAVSPRLKEAFLNGGLSEFRKFVLEHKEYHLIALLRGNSDKIVIYHNNHVIWELACAGDKVKVRFNYDHARYTADWREKLAEITRPYQTDEVSGFSVPKSKNADYTEGDHPVKVIKKGGVPTGGSIGYISCDADRFSREFVAKSFEMFLGFVNDFFDKEKKADYFRKKVEEDPKFGKNLKKDGSDKGVEELLEKKWQHKLFHHFKDCRNGYYVYDLEFSQPYPTKEDIIKTVGANKYKSGEITSREIKKIMPVNEPDMLAIRFENSVPAALVLIEVKSTYDACANENSGIIKHMEGMKKYIDVDIYRKSRRLEVVECLKQYQEFGFLPEEFKVPDFEEMKELPFECLLVLTSKKMISTEDLPKSKKERGAVGYYEKYKRQIDEALERLETKLMLTYTSYDSTPIIEGYHSNSM